ncbi:DedA family protein [Caulobacter sp. LARHSG274]
MHFDLAPLSALISDHRAWAGLVLGVATFLESLVLIGAFVPATALMLLAGGLIATGALDPVSVVLWSVAGAALGDAVSYGLGRRLGGGVLALPFLRPHRQVIARTRLFSRRHGVASIFLGRFFGPLRAFVPVMAGMARMKAHSFQIANVASAFVWVGALVLPGYLAGKGLSVLPSLGLNVVVVVALALAAAVAGVVLMRHKTGAKPAPTARPMARVPANAAFEPLDRCAA